jgi:transposase
LVAGETDPATLAALAHQRVKAPRESWTEALRGRVTSHHRFLLRLHLRQIDALEAAVAEIDREVEADLEPFRAAVRLLSSIPGVSALSAEVIVAEIGTDMGRFPSAGTCCPGRACARAATRARASAAPPACATGAPWLKTTLVQCAWAAARKKGGYLQAQFQRLRARRGPKKAICAVAASILTAAYHMLRDGTFYQDLGPDHLSRRTKGDRTVRLVRHLTALGYTVQPPGTEGGFLLVVSC